MITNKKLIVFIFTYIALLYIFKFTENVYYIFSIISLNSLSVEIEFNVLTHNSPKNSYLVLGINIKNICFGFACYAIQYHTLLYKYLFL